VRPHCRRDAERGDQGENEKESPHDAFVLTRGTVLVNRPDGEAEAMSGRARGRWPS
jgi:hypothetical protein